jgi:hypothetical protein
MEEYQRDLKRRQEQEAKNLATLTGWNIQDILRKMGLEGRVDSKDGKKWYERIWEK